VTDAIIVRVCTQKGRKKTKKKRLLHLFAEFVKTLSDSDSDDEDSDDVDSDDEDSDDVSGVDSEASDDDSADNLGGANRQVQKALNTNTNQGGAPSKFRKYLAKAKKLHPAYEQGIDDALSVFKCNSSGPAKAKLRALIGAGKA
jgi:hypothetical protein